jgi:hypothetical protein
VRICHKDEKLKEYEKGRPEKMRWPFDIIGWIEQLG